VLEDSFQLPPAFLAQPAQRVPQPSKGVAVVRCLCLEVPLVPVRLRLRLRHSLLSERLRLRRSLLSERLRLQHSLLSERLRQQHSLRSERLRLQHSLRSERLRLGHRLRSERLRLRHSLRSERLHLRLPHSPHLLSVPAPPSALLLKRHRRPLLEAEVRQQGPLLGSRAACSRALSSARRRAVASSARPPVQVRLSLAASVRGALQVDRACLASLQVFSSHRPLCSVSRVLLVRPLSANLRKGVLSLLDSRAQASPRLRVLSVSGSSHNNRTPCNRAPWPSEVRCPLEQQLVRSERHLLLQLRSVAVLSVSRRLQLGVLARVVALLEGARLLPVALSELLGGPPLLEHLRSMQA